MVWLNTYGLLGFILVSSYFSFFRICVFPHFLQKFRHGLIFKAVI